MASLFAAAAQALALAQACWVGKTAPAQGCKLFSETCYPHSLWCKPLGDRLWDAFEAFVSSPDRPAETADTQLKGDWGGWLGHTRGGNIHCRLLGCSRLCCRSILQAVRGCADIIRWRPGGAGYPLRKVWTHALKQDQQAPLHKGGCHPHCPYRRRCRRSNTPE